jgi:LEA14-like dessication related protein
VRYEKGVRPLLALTAAAALATLSCSKPDPPVLTPKSAKLSGITPAGVTFDLSVEAFNPNSVELAAQSVTGKVVLDGKYDLGTATVAKPVALPAGARTTLDIPLSLRWNDVLALGQLAASNRAAPYAVDGTVTVGGARLNVDLPFHMTGTVTHEELVQLTTRSLPAIPGIPGLTK